MARTAAPRNSHQAGSRTPPPGASRLERCGCDTWNSFPAGFASRAMMMAGALIRYPERVDHAVAATCHRRQSVTRSGSRSSLNCIPGIFARQRKSGAFVRAGRHVIVIVIVHFQPSQCCNAVPLLDHACPHRQRLGRWPLKRIAQATQFQGSDDRMRDNGNHRN